MVDRPTRSLLSGASLRCSAARCDRWWQSIWHAAVPAFPLIASCVAAALALLSRRRIAPPVPRLDTGKEQEGQAPRRLRKAETILRRRTSRLLLVLEGSYDLHNKAAVCRTADCLGIQNVWMVNSRAVGDVREGRGKTEGRERRGVGEGLEDEQAAPQETPPTEAESVESRADRKGDWVVERVSEREAAKRKPPRKTQRARKEAEIRMAKQAEMCAQLARLCPGEEPSYEGATASLGGSSAPSLSGKITKQAEEWLSIRQFDSTAECLAALRAERYQIWATVLSQDAIELDSPSLRVPCAPTRLAIVFGSEVVGVSAQMVNAAHRRVYFPIHGFSESLNLRSPFSLSLVECQYVARRFSCASCSPVAVARAA